MKGKKSNNKTPNNVKNRVSYNPFRMWGAWFGGVLSLLIYNTSAVLGNLGIVLHNLLGLPFTLFLYFRIKLFNCSRISCLYSSFNTFMEYLLLVIIGFLIGWLIHSLCRYIKNRRDK